MENNFVTVGYVLKFKRKEDKEEFGLLVNKFAEEGKLRIMDMFASNKKLYIITERKVKDYVK